MQQLAAGSRAATAAHGKDNGSAEGKTGSRRHQTPGRATASGSAAGKGSALETGGGRMPGRMAALGVALEVAVLTKTQIPPGKKRP